MIKSLHFGLIFTNDYLGAYLKIVQLGRKKLLALRSINTKQGSLINNNKMHSTQSSFYSIVLFYFQIDAKTRIVLKRND